MAVERRQNLKKERLECGFYIALFCSNPSRTRVLRTSDAVEVLVRTPAACPLRSEHRCAGDRASWPSSSGCTSPYTRCRGRRASSPRPASDPERNLGCALGRGASPRARVAVAPPCGACAVRVTKTSGRSRRDSAMRCLTTRALMTRVETMTCRTSRRVRPRRPSRRLLGLLRSLPRRR